MNKYLYIDENNILKSITDKLYVYKFDPVESGIKIDQNIKLVTIGTSTIKYFSDLPSYMTERCDHTLITLSGTIELKPRIEVNNVYYYRRYIDSLIKPEVSKLYIDKANDSKYLYSDSSDKPLDLIEGVMGFYKFYSFIGGSIEPQMNVSYYDRNSDKYYQYNGSILLPVKAPSFEVDKGYCIDAKFYSDGVVESSDRFLYKDTFDNSYYIYKLNDEFKQVEPVPYILNENIETVFYDNVMNYFLHTPSHYIDVAIIELGTLNNNPEPSSAYAYYDSESDTYYRHKTSDYKNSSIINYELLSEIIDPVEDTIYHEDSSNKFYRWDHISNEYLGCYIGYKDGNNFCDLNHNPYSPSENVIYKDSSNDRFYMWSDHYSQVHVTLGYYHNESFYLDSSLIEKIDLVEGALYYDQLKNEYFRYHSDKWQELTLMEGYLKNGLFYDINNNYVLPSYSYMYKDREFYYLYVEDVLLKLDLVSCYLKDHTLMRVISDKDFLYSCIISEQYPEPKYEVVETGEYCIVLPGTSIDEYIEFVNNHSTSLYLDRNKHLDDSQVANIFGLNLNDTSPIHYFFDTSYYGKDSKVLLDEKMQISEWVKALRLLYPSLIFYNDPNDRVDIKTHTEEFIYYQAKLFSDDSTYTTPLRYNDPRYGKVRNYDIQIMVRYETPDMVTFLNRRNEYLMHNFLIHLQDLKIKLENGDLIHIGVNWSKSIREEEPDKTTDMSERSVYTFVTQCNLNSLLLERSDNPESIEEIISNIYVQGRKE